MARGALGNLSDSTLTAFVLFIVLVWLSVALGILVAGFFPQLPASVRGIMAPTRARVSAE